jgi:hypothetical protein
VGVLFDRNQDADPVQTAAERESARLRLAGKVVLAAGLLGSPVFYWVQTRLAEPSIEDLIPGSREATAREIGRLMGTFGMLLMQWAEALERPGSEAAIMAGVAVVIAVALFRAARGVPPS